MHKGQTSETTNHVVCVERKWVYFNVVKKCYSDHYNDFFHPRIELFNLDVHLSPLVIVELCVSPPTNPNRAVVWSVEKDFNITNHVGFYSSFICTKPGHDLYVLIKRTLFWVIDKVGIVIQYNLACLILHCVPVCSSHLRMVNVWKGGRAVAWERKSVFWQIKHLGKKNMRYQFSLHTSKVWLQKKY